jgi:hypothetical protein
MGKQHNKIDYMSTDIRHHLNIANAQTFRGADCDIDLYQVDEKVRHRLSVSK